jgi:hypothetical protein
MLRAGLLALVMALPSVSIGQSASVDRIARCESLVVLQYTAAQSRVRPFRLSLRAANGAQLVYVGVRHTSDPADTQFVSMQSEWRALDPTVSFYEGTSTRSDASPDEAIRQDGEPGLLKFLAAKSGISARSFEPSREDEVNALLAKFSPEQLVMFYTLRPIAELRTRHGASKPALDTAVAQGLARMHRIARLKDALPDTAALRAAFAKLAPGLDATDVPDTWFNPVPTSEQTGMALFNNVNSASSFFRDVFMFRQLARASQTPGARIFAEVGRDHIPAQAEALRCVFGGS